MRGCGTAVQMMALVSVLGLWANKDTFINRNGTSGEMLDSLDARDISLRLEDQGVQNLMFPSTLFATYNVKVKFSLRDKIR